MRVYKLQIKKLNINATLPTRAHAEDAGLDLYALEEGVIGRFGSAMVSTGIALELRPGTVGLIADRSSVAKRGLKTVGGVIDSGYRGEVKILLRNLSDENQKVEKGERIAQMLILPIETPAVQEVETLSETSRGEGGFGSSGRK